MVAHVDILALCFTLQMFCETCYCSLSCLSQMKGESCKPFKTTQFHFTTWPDHGVPDYATPILGFHRRVKSQHKPSRGPLLVHCSAGVGRTGTYIAIDNVLDQIATEGIVDISGTIVKSRNQRMKMVQTQVSTIDKLTQLNKNVGNICTQVVLIFSYNGSRIVKWYKFL